MNINCFCIVGEKIWFEKKSSTGCDGVEWIPARPLCFYCREIRDLEQCAAARRCCKEGSSIPSPQKGSVTGHGFIVSGPRIPSRLKLRTAPRFLPVKHCSLYFGRLYSIATVGLAPDFGEVGFSVDSSLIHPHRFVVKITYVPTFISGTNREYTLVRPTGRNRGFTCEFVCKHQGWNGVGLGFNRKVWTGSNQGILPAEEVQ